MACAAVQAPARALPDLDVASISLAPRYPAYSVRIIDGLPQLFDPESGRPLTTADASTVQREPRHGETVTATARVLNHGTVPAGPFRYTWFLNGKKVGSGRHQGLAADCMATTATGTWALRGRSYRTAVLRAGTFVDLSLPFHWRKGRNRLELRVAPERKDESELTDGNHARAESLEGLAFVVLVRRSVYNAMAHLQNADGTYGFEDWIQRYFDLLRDKLESSLYPSQPGGVNQPLRVDTIAVLDDTEDTRDLGDLAARNGWDGRWEYGTGRNPVADAAGTDWTIVRELGRSLGLEELDRLDLLPENVQVREPGSREPVSLGFTLPEGGMMQRAGDVPFDEPSVVALNRLRGARRGYPPLQFYDLPQTCQLRVLDNNGRTIPHAEITVYQSTAGLLSSQPVFSGTSSDQGVFELPNRPAPSVDTAPGLSQHPNPFGKIDLAGGNGVLLVQVAARGAVDYQWVPITTFNVAAGTGRAGTAVEELHTALPTPLSPAPGGSVTAQLDEEADLRAISLTWTPSTSPKVSAYFIYRAMYPRFAWERIGAVARPGYLDLLLESVPGYQVRYAVSAVDLQGNESALQRTSVLFVPDL